MTRILIVEDEESYREPLVYQLTREGYDVEAAETGEEGLELFTRGGADLVLLDLMLPGIDVIALCRRIREQSRVPIIMLTAKSAEIDKVVGLEIGADDYVTKPYSFRELLARIRAVLRRMPPEKGQETLVIGTLSIHLPSLSVTLDGHKLALTRREVELLYTLASSPGRVFTRDNLLTLVWGYEHVGNYRAVDSHIKRLRQKLDAYPHDFFTIATVWGTGYKFERRLP